MKKHTEIFDFDLKPGGPTLRVTLRYSVSEDAAQWSAMLAHQGLSLEVLDGVYHADAGREEEIGAKIQLHVLKKLRAIAPSLLRDLNDGLEARK